MRFQLDHAQLYIRANIEEQRVTGYASRSVATFHRQTYGRKTTGLRARANLNYTTYSIN